MKTNTTILLIICLHMLYAQNISFSEKLKKSEPELNKRILRMMKSAQVQGLSIAIVDSSGMIWHKGYGYKDVKEKIPVDSKTIFCVGSISKLFTSIAIMQLYEQGKLDIHKPVRQYIPEFKPLGSDDFLDEITIKSILMHQSGLPSDNLAMFFTEKPFSAQNCIEYLNTHYTCTKPYIIMSYSNIGYGLLGAIVERVSMQDFNEYIRQHITHPLKMYNSSFKQESHIKTHLSKQYLKKNKEYCEPHIGELMPAGGFYTNMEDLSLFVKMLLNRGSLDSVQIISEPTFKEMVSTQNSEVHLDYDMAIGLTFFITMDGTWFKAGGSFSHGGNTIVFHSGLTVLPYQNLAVILSTNSKKGLKIVPEIERFVLDKALEEKGIDSIFPAQTISKQQTKKYINSSDYKQYEGLYSFMLKPLKLKAKKKSILLKSSMFSFVLKPSDDSTFSVKLRMLGISFKNKNISKMWFDIVDNDTVIVATSWDRNFYFSNKMQKMSAEDTNKWKHIEGVYTRADSSVVFQSVKVKAKNDYIYIKSAKYHGNSMRLTAQPTNNSMLKVCGMGRNTGNTIPFTQKNNTTTFDYAGIIYKKK
ncbi:MAG: beta-lactamase family protein [Bacteroidales bacterium]|nr:beta-lactamase family protein [Bacteroidales bacterium]